MSCSGVAGKAHPTWHSLAPNREVQYANDLAEAAIAFALPATCLSGRRCQPQCVAT
jgi:hypothetical protein